MKMWLISDTHFGHANIIEYSGRPFQNAAEMDACMVAKWNERIAPGDHVYHLGDVAMTVANLRRVMPLLHGKKRLVRGNHDIYKTKEYAKFFEEIHGVRVMGECVLSHIPLHEQSVKQRWHGNIHGHIHEKPAFGPRYLNVCVEKTWYAPILLDDAIAQLKAQQ